MQCFKLKTLYGVDPVFDEGEARSHANVLELDLVRVGERLERVFTSVEMGENFTQWQSAHNGFLAAYRAGDWNCAAQDLKMAREAAGNGFEIYYKLFSTRIGQLAMNAPQNWNGVFDD